jgi:hypothetical protein
MDRIDMESMDSLVHNNFKAIWTLYAMVENWVTQPWDGDRYLRIAEQLWDSLNDNALIEGPFGDSVTLLESCIVDSIEAIESGLLTEKEAVNILKTLLENDDFIMGAKVIEVSVKTNPVCRISNMDHLLKEDQLTDYLKPRWWKRSVRSYWLLMWAVSFVSIFILYVFLISLGLSSSNELVLSIVIGIPMYVMSYYIRTVATKRMWRGVFIMLGAGGIGFWCLALPMGYLFGPIIRLLPLWLRLPLMFIPAVVGAYIGDWLGKRRDYRPYI